MDFFINFDRPEDKQLLYAALKQQRGETIVKIVPAQDKRTIPQNKYYWGCVIDYMKDYIGEISSLAVHDLLKTKFIPLVKFEDDIKLSTRDMTKTELWEYIEEIRSWALKELNLFIPEPGQWIE